MGGIGRVSRAVTAKGKRGGAGRALGLALAALAAAHPLGMRTLAAPLRDGLTLTGQVCARQSGQPIANALVGVNNTWTHAGADGSFQLTLDPAAHVFLRAAAPGYQGSDLVTVAAAGGGILSGTAAFSFCGNLALAGAFTSADNRVKIVPVSQLQPAAPHNVNLIGSTTEDLETSAAIQLPNGRVVFSPLNRQGGVFTCPVPIHYGPGRYLVEINAQAGYALIKLPLFAGVPYQAPTPPPPYMADTAGLSINQVRTLALKDINHERTIGGLPALHVNSRLMHETQAHSDDVTVGGFIGEHAHIGSNGSTPLERIKAAGVSFHEVAEDVGSGQTMSEIIFGLMESPAHRWAIMGDFSEVGIGVARNGPTYILTVDFVRP